MRGLDAISDYGISKAFAEERITMNTSGDIVNRTAFAKFKRNTANPRYSFLILRGEKKEKFEARDLDLIKSD